MITQDQIEARARQIVARGLPRAMAIDEARIELQYESGLAAQATAAKAEAPTRDVLAGTYAEDARMAAQQARNQDPQRAAHAQREVARIDAELETVNAQIAALEQRRRTLVDEKRPYLFAG